MVKNIFYCTLKTVFALKIFKYCSDVFGHLNKHLIRKPRLISKFKKSSTGKQIIPIHLLLNISRSKDKQTMKYHQLIEYKMRNIFREKSYIKCGWKNCNHGQNIWLKIKEFSKIGQHFKNLVSNFVCFDSYCQSLIS